MGGPAELAAVGAPLSASERKELVRLRSKVTTLTAENASLTVQVSHLTGAEGDAVKLGVLTTKAEMAEKLLEQFKAGLESGLAMATCHRLCASPPPSAAVAKPP